MASSESAAEIKQRLVQQLAYARAGLVVEAALAKEQFRPLAIVTRSLTNHKVYWLAGTAVAGLILVRLLFPPKIRSDISGKTARKRGVSGLLRGAVMAFAQRSALRWVQDHYQDQILSYLPRSVQDAYHAYNPRQGPPL